MALRGGGFGGEDDDGSGSYGFPATSAATASAAGVQTTSMGFGGGGGGQLSMLNMYNGSRRRGAYRDWRREVTAFMMAFQVPKEQQAPRVWLRLAGEAKDAVEHLDMETELATEKGLDLLLGVLDQGFVEEECDRVDEAVTYFWNLRREYGQSMETYIANMHQAKQRMKKEDPTTTIGDKA